MPFGVIFFSDYLLFIDNYSTINKDKNVIKGEFHVKSFKRKFIIFRS